MNSNELKTILESVSRGELTAMSALERLKDFPYLELGYAKIDYHREIRTGYPEIIFCQGKSNDQLKGIFKAMSEAEKNIIGTRADNEMYEAVKEVVSNAVYYREARIISVRKGEIPIPSESGVAIISAGTSDMPVAEEAAVTAELLGNRVVRIYDAGVAGIHRLLDKLPEIKSCRVVVVIAGMEGALSSVVGGLVDKPIIAVPTSVGYGANFSGLSALLAMLTSCAAGVSVVNIDNGFGAGFAASRINKL